MLQPKLRHNDYRPLLEAATDSPRLSVSVIIPAHGQQERLDVVLAALAAQTYPDELLEVVVVDDGSQPALQLPEIRPPHCRIIEPLPGGWSSAHATNSGVAAAEGEVVLRLDSDMLAWHNHVASQMRFHHQIDYALVLGHKRFVDYAPGQLEPAKVHDTVAAGAASSMFQESDPHWIEAIIDRTAGLAEENHRAFRVTTGATWSMHRDLFKSAGGFDASMVLGSDTEFGHRGAQAGAVFIPDQQSSAWHLGRTQINGRRDDAKRYRRPFIANRVPELDPKRPRATRSWVTPLVDVFLPVADFVDTERCVNALLAGSTPDIRVNLLATSWPDPASSSRHPLDDPHVDQQLLRELYRGEARVRLVSAHEEDAAVPYRLYISPGHAPSKHCVRDLVGELNRRQLGCARIAAGDNEWRLERASALSRARHLAAPGEDLDAVIEAVWGVGDVELSGPCRSSRPDPAPRRRGLVPAGRAAKRRMGRLLRRGR